MHYTQLFRQLRESRHLSHDALAGRARCHRNTVINAEQGRSAKFSTLANLMEKMGYAHGSAEMRAFALLWIEAVSGIPFSRPETVAAATKQVSTYRLNSRQAARQLSAAVIATGLTVEQIRLLVFSARRPEVMAIIEAVRDLVESPAQDLPELKVAEEK